MDAAQVSAIVTASLLIVSELLPFLPLPANGVLNAVFVLLAKLNVISPTVFDTMARNAALVRPATTNSHSSEATPLTAVAASNNPSDASGSTTTTTTSV